jgi:hypothetical protein
MRTGNGGIRDLYEGPTSPVLHDLDRSIQTLIEVAYKIQRVDFVTFTRHFRFDK